ALGRWCVLTGRTPRRARALSPGKSSDHSFRSFAMRTPAPLITALALGALVTPALSAQSATDLAEVCKTLGNAKVGQWASFEGTSASGGGKLRLAVVGSEREADRKSTRLNSSHVKSSYA